MHRILILRVVRVLDVLNRYFAFFFCLANFRVTLFLVSLWRPRQSDGRVLILVVAIDRSLVHSHEIVVFGRDEIIDLFSRRCSRIVQ